MKEVNTKILEMHEWLHTIGIEEKDPCAFVDSFCLQLRTMEFPVDRFFCGAHVLHPLVLARAWKWINNHTVQEMEWSRAAAAAVLNPADQADEQMSRK